MSARGIASGLAGSAGVATIAALSLGMTRASADSKMSPPAEHARVTPAVHVIGAKPPAARPAWLRRLLSRSDLPMEAPHHRG